MRRHDDGALSLIIEKLKGFYAKIKAKLGSLSIAGKVLNIIGNIIKCLSGVYLIDSAVGYYKAAKELEKWKSKLEDTEILITNADLLSHQASKNFNEIKHEIRFAIGIAGVGLGMLLDRAGNLMKKPGMLRRGNSMYHDSVRHCDGGLDRVFDKLKDLYNQAKATFKELPIGQKILFVMSKAIKLVSAASLTTDVATLVALKMQMIKYQSIVDGLFSAAENILPFKPVKSVLKGAGLVPRWIANRAIKNFTVGVSKPVIARIFKAALATAIGFVVEKIATIKKAST